MQTVEGFYQTLPYTAATDAQARALVTPPSDDAAHADLILVCEACSAAEIEAVLEALGSGYLDARGCDSSFAGIVAAARGREWGNGAPGVAGDFHDWEWWHIWPDGPPTARVLLEQWLVEALVAARRREGVTP